LQLLVDASRRYHKPVSVCGELAGDPVGVLLLLAMGYRRFSMNTHNISRIKYVLRQSDLGELKALMADGLKHDNPTCCAACLPAIWKNTVWADCCGLGTRSGCPIDIPPCYCVRMIGECGFSYDWGRLCSTTDIGFSRRLIP
jgi:hypothetical protein